MRLHTLEVTAFGPFADTVTVDFDALGADGLFLLHGHTGAGKTSILDAVAFALYGTVPGARRDSKRLHSDHAEPATAPRVALEATLGGRRIRLVRKPEFMRPKLKGVGTTKQNATATLTWLDGKSQNLTRFDEIGLEIERLLGMRADQFFQVVLLPQGEFARFLRAKNEERGVLLERLFDTERFADVETWLAERKRDSATRLGDRSATVERLAAQIATAAGVETCTDPDPQEWAADLLSSARAARKVAADHLAVARLGTSRSAAVLTTARRTLDAQTRARRAHARLAELDETAEHRTRLADELSAARRAETVAVRSSDLTRAERDAERALRTVTTRVGALAEHEDGTRLLADLSWPPADSDAATIDRYITGWTGECAVLDTVLHLDADVRRCEREQTTLTTRRAGVEAERSALEISLEQRPGEVARLQAEREAALTAAATLDALGAAREQAHDAAAAAVEYAAASRSLTAARAAAEHARTHHDSSRESWLDIRERRLDAMASELAGQLADGRPCAVCGSSDHPHPALAEHDAVTEADEKAAFQVVEDAVVVRDEARARVSGLEREIDGLVRRGGDRLPAELAAHLDSARSALSEATRVASRGSAVERTLADLESDTAAQRLRYQELTTECSATTERLAQTTARITELRDTIDGAAGADGSVTRRRDRLTAVASAASELRAARTDADNARRHVSDMAVRLDTAAADADFDGVDSALAAVRDRDRIAAIETALAAAADAAAGARSVLAEPDVVEAAAQQPVDPAPLEAALAEAEEESGRCIAAASDADRRVRDLEGLTGQLWAAADRLGPLRTAHQELERLADVVAGKGQNAKKMSLRSYVLAARLEEVAAAASVRFGRMSSGRFEFVHTDDVGPRGTRGGLGLEVRDDHSGVVRSANTLSGGESFCASLSLALGLADVVAAEAGGVTLDTIFIDEGFGSLDSESLDSVMGVLDELRSGGRTVGIVSHVDEIRDRVPSRLHVIRGRHGSTVEVHAGV